MKKEKKKYIIYHLCMWLAQWSEMKWKHNCRHLILHPWFNQRRWLEWPSMYPKKKSFLHHMHHFNLASHASICSCIVCINTFIVYHKNDFEILTVATMFPVSELDHWIERYHMIKFLRSICILFRRNRPRMINLN